jgi:lysophospholipase L1-like esterase
MSLRPAIRLALGAAIATVVSATAGASTIAQNSSFTITRPDADPGNLRIVAYGDSIYAGYISIFSVARRAAPHVAGEYAAPMYGRNVEVIRRAQSGATASGIYSRIVSATDRAFMQAANTRMVTFEMCGNDYLQARSSFRSQTGTCNYSGLQSAFNACKAYTEQALQYINANAHANVKLKVVGNLYYPGYNADNVLTNCTDAGTGQRINMRDKFLPLLAESNWETCRLAGAYGWDCADNFAEYMAADYDANDDGAIDTEALRYRPGESKESYIQRVTVDLVGTLRDSNLKMIAPTASADYLLSDDTHPTYTGATGTSGSVPVFFATAGAYPNGKNPQWNLWGHDRMGWEVSRGFNPRLDAGPAGRIFACESFEGAATFNDKVTFGPWDVWVEYGDGAGTEDTISQMTIPLSHRYTAPGNYTVEVTLDGPYRSVWEDTTTVRVDAALDGVNALIAELDKLWADGALKLGWWGGARQPLVMAQANLMKGQVEPARAKIMDFVNVVATTPFSQATKQKFTAYALRTHAAAACVPLQKAEPPFGRPKPDTKSAKILLPDLPEVLGEDDVP